MTKAQRGKFGFELGQWAKARRAHGRGASDQDRHDLYRKALGYLKSSRDFTNDEMDKVMAEFQVWSQPDNLNAQMAPEDQEAERKADALEKCLRATEDMFTLGDDRLILPANRERYVAGACRNIIKKEPKECTSAQLRVVLGGLVARVNRLRAAHPAKAAMLDAGRAAEKADQPF